MKNQYKSLEDKILKAVKKGLKLASTSIHVFVNDEEVTSKHATKKKRGGDRRKKWA